MNENRMGKYFKYALGEIILVMVGIILAVQVNQWIEHTKLNEKEKETINLLIRDLNLEKERLRVYQNEINKQEQGIIKFINAIEVNAPLDTLFNYVTPSIDNYVFKPAKPIYQGLIQSNELNIINEQELRDFIVNHFEETNDYLKTLLEVHDELHKEAKSHVVRYFPHKYTNSKNWSYSKTEHSKKVFSDARVTQLLGATASSKNWISHRIDTYFIVRSDSLINNLKKYLNTLD